MSCIRSQHLEILMERKLEIWRSSDHVPYLQDAGWSDAMEAGLSCLLTIEVRPQCPGLTNLFLCSHPPRLLTFWKMFEWIFPWLRRSKQ